MYNDRLFFEKITVKVHISNTKLEKGAPYWETSFFANWQTDSAVKAKALKFFNLIVAWNKLRNFPLKHRRSYREWARLFPWLFSAVWR